MLVLYVPIEGSVVIENPRTKRAGEERGGATGQSYLLIGCLERVVLVVMVVVFGVTVLSCLW